MEKAPNKFTQRKTSSSSGYFYKYDSWSQIKNASLGSMKFSLWLTHRVKACACVIPENRPTYSTNSDEGATEQNNKWHDICFKLYYKVLVLATIKWKKKATIKRLQMNIQSGGDTQKICIDYNDSGGLCECVKICHFHIVHNSLAYLYWIVFDHWSY